MKKINCGYYFASALQLSPLLISTAQADLLDDITKKEIVIATEARYAPFEMLEDGKIVRLGKRYSHGSDERITRGESGSAGYSISRRFLPGLESKTI